MIGSAVESPRGATSDAGSPLASAQRRLWFLHQLAPDSAAYNICSAIELTGPLDVVALRAAVSRIGRRHEALRARFGVDADRPWQWFDGPIPPLRLVDCGRADVDRMLRAIARRPFALDAEPAFAWWLLRPTPQRAVLVAAAHHIVFDGASLELVCAELSAAYRAARTGRPDQLRDPAPSFEALVRREPELADAGTPFWRDVVRDVPAYTGLFGASSAAADEVVSSRFTVADQSRLDRLCHRLGVTRFAVVATALFCLLTRFGGQRDLVIGTPVDQRTDDSSSVVGMAVNTVPLRLRLSGDPSFEHLVEQMCDLVLDALEYRHTPFDRIVELAGVPRDRHSTPLFGVLLAYQKRPAAPELPGIRGEVIEVAPAGAKYELTVTVTDGPAGPAVILDADAAHCGKSLLATVTGYLRTLLDGALREPDTAVSRLPLLGPRDLARLRGQTHPGRYRDTPPVHRLFELAVAAAPDAVALVEGTRHVSYRSLNAGANRLARELRRRGCRAGSVVAVLMPRTVELVVALLAVLKAGAAYLPVTEDQPAERVRGLLATAEVELAIADADSGAELPVPVVVSPHDPDLIRHAPDDLGLPVPAAALAYVLYTSGSTGAPKGVAIEHGGAAAFVRWCHAEFDENELSVVLATTSIGFDLSIFELFVPLTRGTTVVLAESALTLGESGRTPWAGQATLLNTVPAAVEALLDARAIPAGLRAVNLAGEPLTADLVRALRAAHPDAKVRNLYGPSEATTYATRAVVPETVGATPSIGTAITPAAVWVADSAGRPVPPEVIGEVVIGGHTLARGYLRDPARTAANFRPDPHAHGRRVYHTGDLARRRDGRLFFLGRRDTQVQVRGVRIEPGEVEAALRRIPGVRGAAVVACGTGAHRLLVGFVTHADEVAPVAADVSARLRDMVAAPLVPARIVIVAQLPHTGTGKLDRAALIRLAESAPTSGAADRPSGSATEDAVARAWSAVLGRDTVDRHRGFFETGGTSLLLLGLQTRLRDGLGLSVTLVDLFRYPTVAELAVFLDGSDLADDSAPLSTAQARGLRRRAAARARRTEVAR
ncbi:amino acid adenylation domain-containing protein [Nocardia sp. NPDC047038]|uniref:non-ribosomal peptide synthetase n=1 Tax=Nocardia sp. NPDC047038 TaxID=3154338 RepID=UPI0033ECD40F